MKPKHEFTVHYNTDLTCLSLYSPSVDRFMNCGTFSDSSSFNKGAFIFDAPTTGKDETEFEVQFNESARSVTLYYAKHQSYDWSLVPILVQKAVANSSNRLSLVDGKPLELFFEPVSIEERDNNWWDFFVYNYFHSLLFS